MNVYSQTLVAMLERDIMLQDGTRQTGLGREDDTRTTSLHALFQGRKRGFWSIPEILDLPASPEEARSRERGRERGREQARERGRERKREIDRKRESERERGRVCERERKRERERERETKREKEKKREREEESEKKR